jgi:hypothetical protein
MKYKAVLLIILVILMVGYSYYQENYSNKGITNHVIQKDGYTLDLAKTSVPIELFIKPEWIAYRSGEVKNLKIKLLEINHSTIILDNVWNRGNDIYFSFHTTFNMNYKSGTFLYNGIFNNDGSFSSSPDFGELRLLDPNKTSIPLGQIGIGPGSDFSFGIEPKDQKSIQKGFYITYTGFNLYNYSRL